MRIISVIVTTLVGLVVANEKVIVGYYVPWGKVLPSEIDFSKVTHVNYGFGVLQNKPGIGTTDIFLDQYYDVPKIKMLKEYASKSNVKVLMSLGGWTGSQTFSVIVRSPYMRRQFIQEAMKFLRVNTKPAWEFPDGFGLDGIDLDWEYPNRKAAVCNIIHRDDSANYLILLKELREAMDQEFPYEHKLLTAAVRAKPFDDVNGNPLTDVRAYAQYFDFINIMAYDIMGSWSNTTGPNAPYRADINKGGDVYSFTQAIDEWLAAGFPANKLTAGLAGYGRSVIANVNMDASSMYATKEAVTPKGDESDANEVNFFCDEGIYYSGVYKYKFLRKDILINGYTQASNGYTRFYDEYTQTPWLFNHNTKRFISYDDPQSIQVKVDYIKHKNLLGAMFWELSQDFNNELLNVVQQVKNNLPPLNKVILPFSDSNQLYINNSPPNFSPANNSPAPLVPTSPASDSCFWQGPLCDLKADPRKIVWCVNGKKIVDYCKENHFCDYKEIFNQQKNKNELQLICRLKN